MPDIGTNENAPVGVVSGLDDTDDDGRMDSSQVFVDGLILPRGLCWTMDGSIGVRKLETIWLCEDSDGGDRCDSRGWFTNTTQATLEHLLNGLMPALDNWVYNAKEGLRLRHRRSMDFPGQCSSRAMGDDAGQLRLLGYNVNASVLRGDLVPCYSPIALSGNPLVDVQLSD